MAAENPVSTARRAPSPSLARWLRLGAGVVALLLASETLWLWQTWPVRELLQPAPAALPAAPAR